MISKQNEFSKLFAELLDFPSWYAGNKEPTAELKDGYLYLNWDLPGATKDQIEIDTENNIIIVRGIAGRYEGLQSKVRINRDYDMQSIDASMRDGVLTVQMAQGKDARKNKIQIK